MSRVRAVVPHMLWMDDEQMDLFFAAANLVVRGRLAEVVKTPKNVKEYAKEVGTFLDCLGCPAEHRKVVTDLFVNSTL